MKKCNTAQALSGCLQKVNTAAGRRQLEVTFNQNSFPHYEPAPSPAGGLIRVDVDKTRTPGRFVRRQFIPTSP